MDGCVASVQVKWVRHQDGQLEDLPTDGLTGRQNSERGFVTWEGFFFILQDLAKHLDDRSDTSSLHCD